MDSDLLLDMFGFLPEKYFISRNIIKNFQTRVSFVDYERIRYEYNPGREEWYWSMKEFGICHQEYGPAYVTIHSTSYLKYARRHRESGPAIIIHIQESPAIVIDKGSQWFMIYRGHPLYVSKDKLESGNVRLKKVWFEDNLPFKCELESGKIIEVEKESEHKL